MSDQYQFLADTTSDDPDLTPGQVQEARRVIAGRRLDARIRELAKDRNDGREPDELHLAYEREMWRLRQDNAKLRADVDELKVQLRRAKAATLRTGTARYDR